MFAPLFRILSDLPRPCGTLRIWTSDKLRSNGPATPNSHISVLRCPCRVGASPAATRTHDSWPQKDAGVGCTGCASCPPTATPGSRARQVDLTDFRHRDRLRARARDTGRRDAARRGAQSRATGATLDRLVARFPGCVSRARPRRVTPYPPIPSEECSDRVTVWMMPFSMRASFLAGNRSAAVAGWRVRGISMCRLLC
jgi:hypothetical protein